MGCILISKWIREDYVMSVDSPQNQRISSASPYLGGYQAIFVTLIFYIISDL